MKRAILILTVVLFLGISSAPLRADSFSVPDGLENEVRFWETVFGTYGSDQVVIYDERFLEGIYEVVDRTEVNRAVGRITKSLRHLAAAPKKPGTDEERYYRKLFGGTSDPEVFRAASGRVRVQPGQKGSLRRAIEKSSAWMGDIESIFEANGLPKELTALMFIESMFNPRALSGVGASGVWQFMPETGRSYVSMNDFWDDRNDTINSSTGAALFLKDLYRQTGDWCLAVNAYHSGLGRILNAVKKLGTKKIADIIHHYNDPGYSFYSRNYVPEFLAVVALYRHRAEIFGSLSETEDRRYDIVQTSDFVILPKIADRFGIGLDVLRRLNTALKEDVLTGDLPLPPHYPLRVPKGTGYYLAVAIGYPSSRRADAR